MTAFFSRALFTLTPALLFVGIASNAMADDRLTFSANGTRLANIGGAGAEVDWLHNFSPDALLGVGVTYQTISNAHWTYGSVSGAYIWGGTGSRWSVSGEAHRGNGWNGTRNFTYQDVTVGTSVPLNSKFSVQLEDRQLDIDTSHGNLPKLGASFLLNTHLLTSLSYAHSVGGNLGTHITTGRADYYLRSTHWVGGGSFGTVDPLVLHGQVLPTGDHRSLREGFAGVGRTSPRSEWLLLGDYQKLDAQRRVTLTLNYTIFLNGPARGIPGK
jgi:hypothetical protein